MSYLEELLPEFRKGAKIRRKCWSEGKYIKLKGLYARDEYGDSYFLEPNEVTSDDWELNQEPIDWQYIIDNKCPVWCWDYNESKKNIEILKSIKKYETYKFSIVTPDNYVNDISFTNCRPVRRDEVAFYEDKKDEQD